MLDQLISWGAVAVFLVIGFFFGSTREKKHYQEIMLREKMIRFLPTRSDSGRPEDFQDATEVFLVSASVVIASDYFKTFVANIKNFFGGRLTTYESLLDRARREAVLRVKEKARARGARELIHLRLETSVIDQAGVEILAYATAIKK